MPGTRPTAHSQHTTDARRREFARVLSDAIKQSDLTLEQIAGRLAAANAKTSPATLSYWQNGHSLPTRGRSMEVVALLEDVLGLPQGQLTRFLTKGPCPGSVVKDVYEVYDAVNEVLAGWGLSLTHWASPIACTDVCFIGEDRRSIRQEVGEAWRVEAESLAAIPLSFDDPNADRAPVIDVTAGGELGRLHTNDAAGQAIAELVLPRRYSRGERFWTGFTVDWAPTGNLNGAMTRVITEFTKVCVFDLVFEGEVPQQVWQMTRGSSETMWRRRPAPVHGNRVSSVHEDLGPGAIGFAWFYDPEAGPPEGLHFADD